MLKRKHALVGALALSAIMVLVGGAMPATAGSAQQAAPFQVVASGLNNPRGLAFTTDGGDLLVAEAGMGGSSTCFDGPEGRSCLGSSGAIARVEIGSGKVERVVAGLPSIALAEPPGFNAVGAHDVVASGKREFYIVMGLGGSLPTRNALGPNAALFGHLVHVKQGSAPHSVADLVAFEQAIDPDREGADSNPYSLVRRSDRIFVVDAGGNSLLAIDDAGKIQVASVMPSTLAPAPPFIQPAPPGGQIPMQAVPNSAAIGPDGAVYVGQLTGFPFPVGGASVYRIGGDGRPEVYASGFTNIIDIDFDRQGNLYVLEIAKDSLLAALEGPPTGRLIMVARGSKAQTVLASDGLVAPGSVLVDDDAIYISNFAVFPGQGQIIRIARKN